MKKRLTFNTDIILASESVARISLLKKHKILAKTVSHEIDEKKMKEELKHLEPEKVVFSLARAKARSVLKTYSMNLIIGSDQILYFDNEILNKPRDIEEGIHQLKRLNGKTHTLISSVYILNNGRFFAKKTKQAVVKMETLKDTQIEKYAENNEEILLTTLGGYRIEEGKLEGIKIISGDTEDVMGFPIRYLTKKIKERKKIFVIGNPIKHSVSPNIHNFWIKKNNLNASYEKLQVKNTEINLFAKVIKKDFVLGANITIPLKEKIISIAENIDWAVKSCGAANTLHKRNKQIHASNTDGKGFVNSLMMDHNFKIKGKNVFVIGAGGAAKGIVMALFNAKAAKIILSNRNSKRAEDLIRLYKKHNFDLITQPWENKAIPKEINLVVNSTSVGMKLEDKLEFDLSKLNHKSLVYDIVYNNSTTFLMNEAKKNGLRSTNGIDMLLRQAAESFCHWFGFSPTEAQIKKAKNLIELNI